MDQQSLLSQIPRSQTMYSIFVLDMFMSKLSLTENGYRDSGGEKLMIRVNLINFPALEVNEYDRDIADDIFDFEFKRGQSYLFAMEPNTLVHKIKGMSVTIGVYREGDTFPICDTRTRLTGCVCNLIAMPSDDTVTVTFDGPFDLVDPGNNHAGTLTGEVRLSNCGRTLVMRCALLSGSAILKNVPEGFEFRCYDKIRTPKEIAETITFKPLGSKTKITASTDPIAENFMLDVIGIAGVANRIADGIPLPSPTRTPLIDPEKVARDKEKEKRRKQRKKDKKNKKKGKKKKKKK